MIEIEGIEKAAAVIAKAITQTGFSNNDQTSADGLEDISNRLHVSTVYQLEGRTINIVDAIDRGSAALENIAEELSRIADYLANHTEKGN